MSEIEKYTETRIVAFFVGGVPDLPTSSGKRSIAPNYVEVTYRWDPLSLITKVVVHGSYRLKSGVVGVAGASRLFSDFDRDKWPEWLGDLVERNTPTDWEK